MAEALEAYVGGRAGSPPSRVDRYGAELFSQLGVPLVGVECDRRMAEQWRVRDLVGEV
jgi:hypothetical protein